MRSSYKDKNYGAVLSSLVIGKRPELCVEFGVLDGYSTIHIASAIKFNRDSFGIDGQLWCWDLWDSYEYNRGSQEEVQERIDSYGLAPFCQIE